MKMMIMMRKSCQSLAEIRFFLFVGCDGLDVPFREVIPLGMACLKWSLVLTFSEKRHDVLGKNALGASAA